MVQKDLYYHEVAYVRGLEARNAQLVAALEDCAKIAEAHDCNGLIDHIDRHRGHRIAVAIRARAALAAAGHKPT
jgi:hypothetical protein